MERLSDGMEIRQISAFQMFIKVYFYFKQSIICFEGGIFSIQIDPEGDIITGGGKDGRIVATSPEGEVLDETSLPGCFQKCVF